MATTKYHKAKTCKWRPEWKLTKNGRLMGDTVGQCLWTMTRAGINGPPGFFYLWDMDRQPYVNPMKCDGCKVYECGERWVEK